MYYILKQLDCNNKLKYRYQVFVIVFLVSRIHEEENTTNMRIQLPKMRSRIQSKWHFAYISLIFDKAVQ